MDSINPTGINVIQLNFFLLNSTHDCSKTVQLYIYF